MFTILFDMNIHTWFCFIISSFIRRLINKLRPLYFSIIIKPSEDFCEDKEGKDWENEDKEGKEGKGWEGKNNEEGKKGKGWKGTVINISQRLRSNLFTLLILDK